MKGISLFSSAGIAELLFNELLKLNDSNFI